MAEFGAYGGPYGDSSSWDPRKVDVLEHQITMEYVDFNRTFVGRPDYKFLICGMSSLITKDTERMGQTFRLGKSSYDARIQCSVSFSFVQLSLAVYSESSSGFPDALPSKLLAIIKGAHPADDIYLTCCIKPHRYFGRFFPFCGFTFTDRLKNRDDSLLIHLYVQNVWEEMATKSLSWKVDFSNMDIVSDLGLTTRFFADPRGFQMQVRLFSISGKVSAEFRFLKGIAKVLENTQFLIKMILIHPKNQLLNIVHELNFHEWYKPEEWEGLEFFYGFSYTSEIANVEQLKPFFLNNELMIKVEVSNF